MPYHVQQITSVVQNKFQNTRVILTADTTL